MLTLPSSVRVFVAAEPVDLRKSFDGLSGVVQGVLGRDPASGHLHVLLNKCPLTHDDSMPIERQSKQYARSGIRLSPSTVGDWYTFGAEVIKPIAVLVVARVLESFVINADDTGHRVLDPHRKEHIKRARLWCFVGDGKYVAFHYAPDWKAEHPGEFPRDFEGYIQADAYGGYSSGVGPPQERHIVIRDEMRLGCGMHIRRKFEQTAEAGDP